VSVFTVHMVYFCAFARSEIFHKNARELGVGSGQFHAGVNRLNIEYLCTTVLGIFLLVI